MPKGNSPRGEEMQTSAPATSKWGLGREAWAALLGVRIWPECPEPNLSKLTKQLLNAGRRHQATRKADHCLQKQVGKNIKDKKRDKRGRDGAPSQEGSLKKREVSKNQETLSLPSLWRALEAQRAT